MEKKWEFIVTTAYYALLAAFIYVAVRYGVPLFMPFIIALIVASLFKRPAKWLSTKTKKIKAEWIAVFLTGLFYVFLGALVLLSGNKLFTTTSGFMYSLPAFYKEKMLPFLNAAFNEIKAAIANVEPELVSGLETAFNQLTQSIGSTITGMSVEVVKAASNFAVSIPGLLVKLILTVISSFFIAADDGRIAKFFHRLLPDRILNAISHTKKYLIKVILAYIKSYSMIICLTFAELCMGFLILGIKNPLPVAIGIAVFDILPVLGAGGVLIPWAIIMFLIGDMKLAIGISVLYLVVTLVRNAVEPKIVAGRIGLHPLAALVSMFVGATLLGVIGLFGFPVTLAIISDLNKTGAINIFRKKCAGDSALDCEGELAGDSAAEAASGGAGDSAGGSAAEAASGGAGDSAGGSAAEAASGGAGKPGDGAPKR